VVKLAKTDLKETIRQVLDESSRPMDVEKIREACRIGNWQTALKHCLELLYDGKIHGIKSSKSWLFWTKHGLDLKEWGRANWGRKYPPSMGDLATRKRPTGGRD